MNAIYEPHPLALIFPPMDDEASDALAADIKANGLQNPIVLFEGKILDGIQRQEACKRAGVQPMYQEFMTMGKAIVEAAPMAYVLSQNLHRRHLTDSQRAAIAADIANVDKRDTLRQGPMPKSKQREAVTQSQAAKLMKVSRTSVQVAAKIKREAPGLHKAVKAGMVTVNKAAKKIKPQPKPRRMKLSDEPPPYEPTPDEQAALDSLERALKRINDKITPDTTHLLYKLDRQEKCRWIAMFEPLVALNKNMARLAR